MKLHLACGNVYLEGYINIDKNPNVKTDILADFITIGSLFEKNSIDEIMIIHAFAYLSRLQAIHFLGVCYSLLKSGRSLIMEMPDTDILIFTYISTDNPTIKKEMLRCIYGFDFSDDNIDGKLDNYKWGWTKETLKEEMEKVGFLVEIEKAKNHVEWRDMRIIGIK